MQKYINNLQDVNGKAVVGATVTVNQLGGGLATIYSDNSMTALGNPIYTDSLGVFYFYAADGRYTLSVTYGNNSATVTDIILEDPADGSSVVFTDVTANTITLGGNSLTTSAGSGAIGFDWSIIPSSTNKIDWGLQTANDGISVMRYIPVAQWAAIFAGTSTYDATADVQNAINAAVASHNKLIFPAGLFYFNGGQLNISDELIIEGQGKESTTLKFTGSPTASIVTRRDWRVEYDSGNYAVPSIDTARTYAFRFSARNIRMRDLNVYAEYAPSANYLAPPYNSATDYPIADYDIGVLIQYPDCSLDNVLVDGPWNYAGCLIDNTISSNADRVKLYDSQFYGLVGLRIEGPHGQAGVSPNYNDMNVLDTRGSGGISDFEAFGCEFYDSYLRLIINGSSQLVRRGTAGAALRVDGQCSANTNKTIQGHRFWGCRFAGYDRDLIYLNYTSRTEFYGCHTEQTISAKNTDGITTMTVADFRGVESTLNSRAILFNGGEKSGEPDNLVYKNTSVNKRLVTMSNRDDPDAPGTLTDGRMFAIDQLQDRGTWTPSLTAGTPGAPTYSTQVGVYHRVGNLVFIQGRITLSALGGITGNIQIAGLPYTVSNIFGTSQLSSVNFGLVSLVAVGDAGIAASFVANSKLTTLTKVRSGASVQNVTDVDLQATSRFDFSGWYITEDA